MDSGELVAVISVLSSVIVGTGTMVISALAAKAQARKDFISSLQSTIASLQGENQRLSDRLQELYARYERLEKDYDARDESCRLLEGSLRVSNDAVAERDAKIKNLERQIVVLRAKLKKED